MLSKEISDKVLFALLGLTMDEFKRLKCSPLLEYTNKHGVVLEYFVHIDPGNSRKLLDKLNIKGSYFLTFTVTEVSAVMPKK
jgi:hypothetical protein